MDASASAVRARAGSPAHVLIRDLGGEFTAAVRGQRQTHNVVPHVLRQDHVANQLLPFDDLAPIHHFFGLDRHTFRGPLDDRRQVIAGGIADDKFEKEAVQLRLGQRVRALLLDWVLCRHHEEGLFEFEAVAGDRHGAFLHGFQHGGLCLGRGTVDFIRQADLRKEGPLLELEYLSALGCLHHHVRAEDIRRHEVRSKLDARKLQIERRGQRTHQKRLA